MSPIGSSVDGLADDVEAIAREHGACLGSGRGVVVDDEDGDHAPIIRYDHALTNRVIPETVR
jgi:hypothetical protein